ncbi:PREDICTED: uncharacterized protein LOC104698897 [Camelina sativa]|uniref:Uncharacterized protein LOC104698897 n=1 Tax=Camelina sativa TaxID=90675 RepID=A0ABM0SKQ8_CAMSA|nr:PREDICTED: uncharacterized protein LOC104698897 [Camelina sativa]
MNYKEWACGMKTTLCSRKNFGFLDGSIPRPTEGSSDLENWWTIQALLIPWIRMTIDPVLRSNISHRDVAKDLWDHLKKRFSEQDREEDKVHDFLSGLDEPFKTVRSSLVSLMPIQPLEEVYNIVRQEEDLRNNVKTEDTAVEIMAYAVHQRGRVSSSVHVDDAVAVYNHCHRSGHSSDRCFAVVGYPEWWGDRPRSRTVQGRGRGGGPSGERGRNMTYANAVHIHPMQPQERANQVIANKDPDGLSGMGGANIGSCGSNDPAPPLVSGLDDKQWERLMKLLNASGNGGPCSSHEKFRYGACAGYFGRWERVENMCKEGTIVLGSNMLLKSVFYVQDRASRMMIGAGKRYFGTFRFCRTELGAFVTDKDANKYELWPSRMGHRSPKVVGTLPNVYVSVVSELSNKSSLSITFWGECILTAGYLINQTPSSVLNGVTPYEKLHGQPPTYDHVKVFDSLCYAQNQTHKGDKFAPRSRKCVFIEYPYGKKAWRLYDLDKEDFFVSRDVVFSETEFPYATHIPATNIDEEDAPILPPADQSTSTSSSSATPTSASSGPVALPEPSSPSLVVTSSSSPSASTDGDEVQQPVAVELRRGLRPRHPPPKLQDYTTYTAQTRIMGNSASLYPISKYVGSTRFSSTHRAYLVVINFAVEPKTNNQAAKSKVWNNAMVSEIDALEANETWTIEDLPPGKKAIGSKWVYNIKHNSDGGSRE